MYVCLYVHEYECIDGVFGHAYVYICMHVGVHEREVLLETFELFI